ncbi:MAG: peptidase M14 [Phycisphaerae bacterium]|nr:peptidase M14 [Phycisphaerae bacterium]
MPTTTPRPRAVLFALILTLAIARLAPGLAATAPDIETTTTNVPQTADPLKITADYPGGNIIYDKIEENTVFLHQDLRDTAGWWFYWNFQAENAAGRTLTFQFTDGNPIGVLGPAVSTDHGQNWHWLGPKSVSGPAFRYSFSQNEQKVRFSFAIPYQLADFGRFAATHTPADHFRLFTLCESPKGRPVPAARIGKLTGDPKHRILFTARHHACESLASYALEGVIDTVLSDTDHGRWFRDKVEILAIPFVDLDGVEDGDQGKNRKPRDHNRDYLGDSIYPEVRAIRDLVPNWSDGKLRAAIDLHCPWIRGEYNEVIYMVGSANPEIWKQQCVLGEILEKVQTGPLTYRASDNLPFGKAWNTGANYASGKSCSRWAGELPGIALSTGLEIPYANANNKTVTAETARAFGRDLALALYHYLKEKM